MSQKTLNRSFAGGEIAPELAGRLDLTKYQTGLSLARNVIVLPHGPVTRRPGFEFVQRAKDSRARLIPFVFSADQSAVIELGPGYARFHIDGGTLLEAAKTVTGVGDGTASRGTLTIPAHGYSIGDWLFVNGRYVLVAAVVDVNLIETTDLWGAGVKLVGATTAARVHEIATPYAEQHLFQLRFAQSNDVLTLTHDQYGTRELRRLSATQWQLSGPVSFTPTLAPPEDFSATATVAVATNLTTQRYVLTAVAPDGVTESLQTETVGAANNLTLAGNFNTLTWEPLATVLRYRAYKQRGGAFGYIGSSSVRTGAAINSITFVGTTATVNTATPHNITTGTMVRVAGAAPAEYNTWGLATVTTPFQFTYEMASAPATNATTVGGFIWAAPIVDDNVTADTLTGPPEDLISLNTGAGDYPTATTYHEQRRWFAGTVLKPQVLWCTRIGTENNLTSSTPARDADAMEVRAANAQNNRIKHLVSLSDLLALTAGGEMRIYSDNSPSITPTAITIKPQGYAGANDVQPVVTTGSVLYVQAQGSSVRELAYSWESNSYRSIDLSLYIPRRSKGVQVRQLAYSRAPESIAWAARSDGVLAGLTYVPEQQVGGWHFHDTASEIGAGSFTSVCVVPEDNEDVLYVIANRYINGAAVAYIERMQTPVLTDLADAFFVDSGLSYSGTPVTSIGGLWHLEGETVAVLADGAVVSPRTVVNGSITLPEAASKVAVGLPYTSDIRTLPLALEGAPAVGRGTTKNISRVHVQVSQTNVLRAGPSFDKLREHPARAVTDPMGSPPELRDGTLAVTLDPSWGPDGAVCIRQEDPLPLTVLSMALEFQLGG